MQNKGTFPYILSGIIISVLSFIAMAVYTVSYLNHHNGHIETLLEISKSQKNIIYYDEALTMSARMAAFTGDKLWKARYDDFVKKLDNELLLVSKKSPNSLTSLDAKKTTDANKILVEIELNAFKFVSEKKKQEAQKLLFSTPYMINKEIYQKSMIDFEKEVQKFIKANQSELKSEQRIFFIYSLSFLMLLLTVWLLILRKIIKLDNLVRESEKKKQEQSLHLAMLGELTLGFTHDVINPLMVIDGYTKKLKKEISDEKTLKSLEKIQMSTENAINICKNIAGFQRKDSYEKTDVVKLDDLINSSLLIASKRISGKGVEISKNYDKELTIKGSKSALQQVITNLVINSVDAIENLPAKWIIIEYIKLNSEEFIRVKDSGEGINEEISEKIFDFQFTTKEDGKGSGIGLAMSKKLMVNMGGDLVLEKDTHFTTFLIRLPRKESSKQADQQQQLKSA